MPVVVERLDVVGAVVVGEVVPFSPEVVVLRGSVLDAVGLEPTPPAGVEAIFSVETDRPPFVAPTGEGDGADSPGRTASHAAAKPAAARAAMATKAAWRRPGLRVGVIARAGGGSVSVGLSSSARPSSAFKRAVPSG